MNGTLRPGVQQLLFGWVNFALTAPAIYLWLGLPLIMRQQGWSGTEIGVFQLAGLPAVFKALLAIPVERWLLRRRSALSSDPAFDPSNRVLAWQRWAWLTGGGFTLCLLALAAVGEDAGKGTLFALALLAALLSTWADIPVQALAIGLLPPQARPLAGGIRAAATFAGAVVGGGLMLLLQQARGWALPFLILAAAVSSALVIVAVLGRGSAPSPQAMSSGAAVSRLAPWRVWRGFFQQPGAPAWTLLLAGQFPFVAAAWVFLKPLLLDHGLPAAQVALVAGVGGGALGAGASLAAGWVRRERLMSMAWLSAWANVLALGLFAAVLGFQLGVEARWGLLAGSAALALAMGLASSLAFALMMEFSRDACRATDYGLQAGLFALSRVLVPPVAGLLLDRFGDAAMLGALAALALCTALAGRRLRQGASTS
ncbi:MFS transporter [Diaphorobacter sp. HDW4A]|uniref:MFS transporter n=1 Tax=Betaproteobacteria TaxID=28216 RepID=UPI00140D02D3|nr:MULTISPECIES: MFS transporter [Betaproteobacteria]MCK6394951.1 MFS transporter [Zoogloea sp.]QIL78947.1 MFS transporter [Diaphorobacter sp. HDW4A]